MQANLQEQVFNRQDTLEVEWEWKSHTFKKFLRRIAK